MERPATSKQNYAEIPHSQPRKGLKNWIRSHLTDERIGYHLGKWIARSTPLDLQPAIFSTIESMAGRPVVLPSDQQQAIRKGSPKLSADKESIDKVSKKVYMAFNRIEDPNLRMGYRVLDVEGVRLRLQEVFKRRPMPRDEKAIANYWLENFDSLSVDQSKIGKAWAFVVEDRLSDLGSLLKLGLLTSGLGIRNIGNKVNLQPVANIGEIIAKLPGFFQTSSDVAGITEYAQTEKDREVITKVLADRYGLDNVRSGVLTHPDLGKRILKSGALGSTIYWAPRLVLGYAAYYAFLSSPEFRSFVDQTPAILTASATTGVLAFGMGARAVIDSRVLRRHQYCPDYFETTFANVNGSINEKNELIANPAWGKFGPAMDIFVSGFAPSFAWAWYIDEPYSRYAYGLACYADQVIFAGTNVLWSSITSTMKNREAKKINPNS